jgi:signal transduction histidine kinase/ActR/RegA family two-component response regulator
MSPDLESRERVLTWRLSGLGVRLGQTILVGPFAWLSTGSDLVFSWAAVTVAVILAEALLLRAFKSLRPAYFTALMLTGALLSTGFFSTAAFIFLLRDGPVSLVAAAMLLFSTAISGAVMARGWPLASVASGGAPTLYLLLLAPVSSLVHHRSMSGFDFMLYEAAVLAFIAFMLVFAVALNREGGARLKERARWRMVFDESPLAQARFDATDLHELLVGAANGDHDLGESLRARLSNMDEVLDRIRFTAVNSAFLRMIGRDASPLALVGADGLRLNTHFDQTFLMNLAAAINALEGDEPLAPVEGRLLRDSGEAVEVVAYMHSIPDGRSPWAECIVSVSDVTEVKAAARMKDDAIAAAQTANRAKSEFLAIASHEIRTPLNGMLGMVQSLEMDNLTPDQRAKLSVVKSSGDALLSILNTTLELARIEAGQILISPKDFDLGELLSEIQASYAPQALARGIVLQIKAEPAVLGAYHGDPVRLRQILYNLISNALKFTKAGFVRLEVERLEGELVFRVSDTGIGIAPEQIERLFERFAQADTTDSRPHDGVGLGLAICRELARAMGGDIVGESRLGQGAMFTVSLPMGFGGKDLATPTATGPSGLPKLRILAAEDHKVNQLVLRTLLNACGQEAEFVENGQEAIDRWRSEPWDLILMDVQMPVLDGLAATRMIRAVEAREGRAPVPVIALTANAMRHQVETYLAAGMTTFLAKPIVLQDLHAALGACIEPSLSDLTSEQPSRSEQVD